LAFLWLRGSFDHAVEQENDRYDTITRVARH
jgi:hypothetical protein